MTAMPAPSVAERIFGLSQIWESAHYNFAFFDRVPALDWDAAYREYLPQVMAAEEMDGYYEALQRFVALLQDGHSLVVPRKRSTANWIGPSWPSCVSRAGPWSATFPQRSPRRCPSVRRCWPSMAATPRPMAAPG